MDTFLVIQLWQLHRPKRMYGRGSFCQEHRLITDSATSILYIVEWYDDADVGIITCAYVESLISGKADQEEAQWVRMRNFPLERIAVTVK